MTLLDSGLQGVLQFWGIYGKYSVGLEMTESDNNLLDRNYLDLIPQKEVFVLAPGPKGRPHWGRIPEDAFVIVVNKAIELIHSGEVKCGSCLWLVSEASALSTVWFAQYREAYKGILCIGRALETLGRMKPNEYFKVFDYHGNTIGQVLGLVHGSLSIGGTVSGMGVQLAFHLGAERITLVGVDLFGGTYYDGTEGQYGGRRDGERWKMHMRRFDDMVRGLKEKRPELVIQSLSPTELVDVEVTV